MKYISKELQKEIQYKFFKKYIIHGNKFVLTTKSTIKFFEQNINYQLICQNIFKKQPLFQSLRNVLYCILVDLDLNICHNIKCNKEISFSKTIKKHKYCSYKCTNSDIALCNQKTQAMFSTNIQKYGYKVSLLDPNNRKIANEKSNTIESRVKAFKTRRIKTIENWNNRLLNAKAKYNIMLLDNDLNFGKFFIDNNLFQFHWKCNVCNTEFTNRFTDLKGILCPKCHKLHGSSIEEHEFIDFIANIVGKNNIITRKMILKANSSTRFQIDAYIPKLKIGFEYDGLYYHQYNIKYKNFHLNKTILAEENNIKLVHIRSDMWLNENIKTKQLILNILTNNIDFTPQNNPVLLYVDRSIFNKAWLINGYTLIKETSPKILKLRLNNREYLYQDCGILVYQKDLSKCIQ